MKYKTSFVAAFMMASPVSGHHSDAGIAMESVIAFEGTVTEFNWRNPHVYVSVQAVDESGNQVEWALQMGTVNGLIRRGWTPESLSSGDRVTVRAHPAQGGRPYAIVESIDKDGGLSLSPVSAAPNTGAAASSLAGVWTADRSKLISYPGGFDGFFRAQLVLTEQGKAAVAEYDALSDENPESTCIGRPTPAAIVSSSLYLFEIDIDEDENVVVFRSEYFDEVRTVYLDGRGHPEGSERFVTGHSIGRWEDDVLVVDTTNFTDHRSPYQIGVPSGAQKHVVERYRLIEDGTRIELSFLLDDPEYLAEPMSHSRELIYSPQMERFLFDCDPEATRRFVPD